MPEHLCSRPVCCICTAFAFYLDSSLSIPKWVRFALCFALCEILLIGRNWPKITMQSGQDACERIEKRTDVVNWNVRRSSSLTHEWRIPSSWRGIWAESNQQRTFHSCVKRRIAQKVYSPAYDGRPRRWIIFHFSLFYSYRISFMLWKNGNKRLDSIWNGSTDCIQILFICVAKSHGTDRLCKYKNEYGKRTYSLSLSLNRNPLRLS